ncbi:hypothetical protein C0J52_12456 [Blattella germanica]|nr:hypothetical protein C0J52_12456 [Blattella germanica]
MFPGAQAEWTEKLQLIHPHLYVKIPIYRVMDRQGQVLHSSEEPEKYVIGASSVSESDFVSMPAGVLMWRGFSIDQCVNQCFGNIEDEGRGKQMPIHYGSKSHHFVTISSPLTTQLPQVATMDMPYPHQLMSSTAVTELLVMGQVMGYRQFEWTETTRWLFTMQQKRHENSQVGHHSTSDDSSAYRSLEEVKQWGIADSPILRFRQYLHNKGWWDDERERSWREETKKMVVQSLARAEKVPKPNWREMFQDVYYDLTPELE